MYQHIQTNVCASHASCFLQEFLRPTPCASRCMSKSVQSVRVRGLSAHRGLSREAERGGERDGERPTESPVDAFVSEDSRQKLHFVGSDSV